ncbi:MAG: hypothetical protein KC466_20235 [Myxococcales bacterium]|nr:hypothetical protein [Myxococcales bacterium]
MNKKMTGEEQFASAVPGNLQEDLIQRIEECAWGFTTDPEIEITDVEKRNVLNIEYTGVVQFMGQEHRFHIRSGDAAGTEILSWNGETEIDREPGPVMILAPLHRRASEAIYQGQAAELLRDWEEALDPRTETGKRLSRLSGAAAYDAFFAPGTGASRSHHEAAREAGYEIQEAVDAARIRRDLLFAAHPIAPLITDQTPLEALRSWDAALDASTVIGHLVMLRRAQILDETAMRGASAPNAEGAARMREVGFAFTSPGEALRLRVRLTRTLLSLDPIDGLDPATLPENPVAALFNRLDPALAPDVRVRPEVEAPKLLDAIAERMARDRSLTLPDWAEGRAAEIGLRVRIRAEPEPEVLPSP